MSAPVARLRRIGGWSSCVVCFSVVVVAGCDSSGDSGSVVMSGTTGAAPVQHHMLQNIPLPAGFRMVAKSSHAVQSGSARFATMEFEGETYPDRVVNFYTEYMPAAKFRLLQKSLDRGETKMRFESDEEECIVRVRPKDSKHTALGIDLRPLSKVAAQPPGPTNAATPPRQ